MMICYNNSISWTIFTLKTESQDLQSHMTTNDNLNQTNFGLCKPLRIKPRIARHLMQPRSNPPNRATLNENSVKWIWRCASIFTWKTKSHDTLSLTFFLCTTWKLSLSKSSKVLHHHHLQSPSFTQREILCVRPVFGLWIPFLFYNSKYLFLVFDIFHSSLSLIYFLLLLIYYFLVY